MANRFQRLRESLERLIFAGLKPDAAEVQKKSKIASLVESAEELAGLGLRPGDKPLPGPMSIGQKLGIVAGILLVGFFVYVLVTVLRHPAQQAESTGPAPRPIEIVPNGIRVDKNRNLEPTWFDSCCEQIMMGSGRGFPVIRWTPLREADGKTEYTPVLSRIKSRPYLGTVQFDVYFYNLCPHK